MSPKPAKRRSIINRGLERMSAFLSRLAVVLALAAFATFALETTDVSPEASAKGEVEPGVVRAEPAPDPFASFAPTEEGQ